MGRVLVWNSFESAVNFSSLPKPRVLFTWRRAIARQTALRYVIDPNREGGERRGGGGLRAKEIISNYLRGAYLNGCRRNNDCCYDWDNYIGARITGIKPLSRVAKDQAGWKRKRRRRSYRQRSRGTDNDISDAIIVVRRVPTVCTRYIYNGPWACTIRFRRV